ncbi:NUDIX domain-containing protein [Pseudovirgaria hyperparasitica]|uniref:NUDIX domain-containing protein n=1 Tax=Pseudovirgaria hyperparasitica TaxID=470096 RepID=A0A6A6W268_9PEZI|nr:NUDIX domain-containing protein [Pseudovirgaria hyperparasitica]KAF2756114.1 NUDIX domain-containing protein [Pseudovirgaria hyperparasitica]
MAASKWPMKQYSSAQFIESAGTVLFSYHEPFSNPPSSALKICLLHYLPENQLLLPKGRRNIAETRAEAALRETCEETGCECSMLPVSMETRCTLPMWGPGASDRARKETVQGEAFFVTHRELGDGSGIKVIWWYVAVAREGQEHMPARVIEGQFKPVWVGLDEAETRLTFEGDREIVKKAIMLVRGE